MNLNENMNKFNSLTKITRQLIIGTSIFLFYGYLSRLTNLYFFWESKPIGWSFVFVTIIFILRERIQMKKLQNNKTVSERIAIGILALILISEILMVVLIPQTEYYQAAKEFLYSDHSISEESGGITNIILLPTGGFSSSSTYEGQKYSEAQLSFIVKGNVKFMDVHLQLMKENDSNWTIINLR